MPVWLEIVFACVSGLGGVGGVVGLIGAFYHLGRIHRDVQTLTTRAETWDGVAKDVAYIKGRLDGRQEGLDETAERNATRRRSRAALAAVKSV